MGVALHRTIIVIIGLGCVFGAWPFLACLLFTSSVPLLIHLYSIFIDCTLFN
jgi:hypothetical protein